MEKNTSRYVGCLLGLAVGDAMGYTVDDRSLEQIRTDYGPEGLLVASKIADRSGITRSVIVNALRKLESAGVIESRSSGMKGTYIKVVNDYVFTELESIKSERSN